MDSTMDSQPISDEELLARYAAGPERLETALAGLSGDDLDTPAESGGWTIRQIVHHVVDGDDLWKVFIKRAIGNPAGRFELQWYWEIPQTEWAQHWDYARRDLGASLALYRASRAHVVQLLESIPGAWEKSLLIHWPGGNEKEYSVRWVVEMQARHVEEHIGELQKLRRGF